MRWVAFIALAVGVASAGPNVEIRAHTQLSLGAAKRIDADQVEISGHLTDKLTGDPIPNERVTISVAGQPSETATTGQDGSFRIRTTVPPGPIEVSFSYRGGGRLEEAAPLTVTTDPAKSQLELSLVKIVDEPAGARIKANASTDDGPTSVAVLIEVSPAGSDHFKKLRTVEANTEFLLSRREVGGPGTHRLRATFAGDDTRQPATASATIELTSGTETSMSLSATSLAFEDELVVTGRVLDDDKQPLAHTAVTLMSGDRRLAQGATNDAGRYRFEVEAEIIGKGQFGIQVKSDPGSAYVRASQSAPGVIKIAAPQPVPVSYTVAAFIATFAAAGGFFAARTKPWQKLRRPAPPAEVPSEEGEIE